MEKADPCVRSGVILFWFICSLPQILGTDGLVVVVVVVFHHHTSPPPLPYLIAQTHSQHADHVLFKFVGLLFLLSVVVISYEDKREEDVRIQLN